MSSNAFVLELAALAHRLWCEKMMAEGWRYGPVYDERLRAHDALVPFEGLGVHDRRAACLAVEAQEFAPRLADAIHYGRGPDRELTAEEMRPGLRVGWSADLGTEDDAGSRSQTGVVESWVVDRATGVLSLVRVRWDDGELSEHHPSERELRRLDEPST